MKFLCDNCKAKYQIADEKVAGKTVRMKCRKCGHQIEVRSAVTEGTGSIPPPAPLPGLRAPPKPMGGGLATSLSAQKPKAPAVSVTPNSALAGAFTKNVNDAPASNVTGSQTGSGGGIELSVTDEWYVAINGVPVGPVRISELRRKAATGAVTEDSLCWQEGLEEWRPVKTIPELAQIVREAAAGNRHSLADSQPAPGRISTFPSAPKTPAAAPVRPSTIPPAPAYPSHGGLSHGGSAPGASASMPVATTPMGNAPTAPRVSPLTPAAPAARSNVVPLRPNAPSSPMTPSLDDLPLGPFGGTGAAATAYAPTPSPLAPQTSPLPVSSPLMPAAAPLAAPDPFAPSGPVPAASPFSLTPGMPPGSMSPQPAAAPMMGSQPSFGEANLSRPSFHPPQPSFSAVPSQGAPVPVPVAAPEKKGGTPLWFWPILVLFLGFGAGGAYFVFAKTQQPVVIHVPAPAAAPAPAPAPTPSESVALEVPAPEPIAQNDVAPGTKPKPGVKKPAGPAPEAAGPKGGLDLTSLNNGSGGPNVGPGPGGGGGSGGGLDQNGVERVVSAHRAGVKRTCWERGGADQKSSVNVSVQATVAPNGQVQSVSSSGDDPVVGKCIENQVRTWTFPAPGSTTQINIPFKFVRQ